MVVAQLFEVTAAADGTELSSKRGSKLSRRYHRHKKQLRQSAMIMAEVSSDAWVCPKCSYKNQDYQHCMGPGCDEVRPGSIFDTSEFALSHQCCQESSRCCRQAIKETPPSLTRVAGAHREDKCFRKHYPAFWPQAKPDGESLPSRPAPLREFHRLLSPPR